MARDYNASMERERTETAPESLRPQADCTRRPVDRKVRYIRAPHRAMRRDSSRCVAIRSSLVEASLVPWRQCAKAHGLSFAKPAECPPWQNSPSSCRQPAAEPVPRQELQKAVRPAGEQGRLAALGRKAAGSQRRQAVHPGDLARGPRGISSQVRREHRHHGHRRGRGGAERHDSVEKRWPA